MYWDFRIQCKVSVHVLAKWKINPVQMWILWSCIFAKSMQFGRTISVGIFWSLQIQEMELNALQSKLIGVPFGHHDSSNKKYSNLELQFSLSIFLLSGYHCFWIHFCFDQHAMFAFNLSAFARHIFAQVVDNFCSKLHSASNLMQFFNNGALHAHPFVAQQTIIKLPIDVPESVEIQHIWNSLSQLYKNNHLSFWLTISSLPQIQFLFLVSSNGGCSPWSYSILNKLFAFFQFSHCIRSLFLHCEHSTFSFL